MDRQRSDDTVTTLLNLFMVAKWWVCPLVALAAYLVLALAIPALLNTNPVFCWIGKTSPIFAPWAAVVILATGLIAAMKRWASSLLLGRQTGADSIRNLSWREFEELVGAAYRRQGYKVIETGGGGADGGIDLVLLRDEEKVLVQCKHWRSSKVGVKLVRELHGLTHSKEHQGSRGILVTFGTYTVEATRFANENGIELIGHKTLLEMIESAKQVRTVQVLEESKDSKTPSCPVCGNPMVVRLARRGDNAGNKFWGCTAYPACRGTSNY